MGPPDEMIDDGLVHTADGLHSAKHTRDQNLHDSKHSYPHILSPKYGTYRRVTFVGEARRANVGGTHAFFPPDDLHRLAACYGTFLRVRTLLPLVKAWLGAALRHHPTARFVLLVKHDLMATVKYRLGEEMEWFANRLEVPAWGMGARKKGG